MNAKLVSNLNILIKNLKHFEHRCDSIDHVWDVILPAKNNKWHHIRVTKYREVYYVGHMDGNLHTLELTAKKEIQADAPSGSSRHTFNSRHSSLTWEELLKFAVKWLKVVQKDWIKANKTAHESYPLNRRSGILPHSVVRVLMPDIYRIDRELGKAKLKKFISLVEAGYFRDDKNITRDEMTANDFFDYCKIAYLAGQRKDDHVDEDLTGREMYKRYADGRDEGLLEITGNSKQEFADWIDGKHTKKTTGGHPWEIKRGGNTTHIDLYVSRPSHYRKEGFVVTVCGSSNKRLLDKLFKVFLKDGREQWVLVHLEVQGKQDDDFPKRMFIYGYRIYDKYQKPIVSCAILTDEAKNWRPSTYQVGMAGSYLRAEYLIVKLIDYQNKISQLDTSTNPFASVILTQLAALDAKRKPDDERKRVKYALTRRLYDKGFSKIEVVHLYKFIDWLIGLSKPLELEYINEVYELEEATKMPYISRAERFGMEKAIARTKLEIARHLLEEGVKPAIVVRTTGCNSAKIKKLQQELKRAAKNDH